MAVGKLALVASSGIGYELAKLHPVTTAAGRLDAAALNAGTGGGGPFVERTLREDLDIVDLDVRSTVHLAELVLHDMASRGSGKELFTSLMPGPTDANIFRRAGMHDTVGGHMPKDDPGQVAEQGYDALVRSDLPGRSS
jgi:NAD(P)-dependent dehydrogenase (short-subunit alcohol dehydrogenase family)